MEAIANVQDFTIDLGQQISQLAEEFKFRSFDPKALADWLTLKVTEGGGWNNKENKLAVAIKACIVWGLGRGTNVRKTEKTLPKGLERINKAIKTLKIKDKGPLTEMKVTIGRLPACFPVLTARILMQMGSGFNKIATSSKLPYYLMFPAALSIIDPDKDSAVLQEFRVYARDFDTQINSGKPSDQGRRANFEKLILESKVVPKENRQAVLLKLAEELKTREEEMKQQREKARKEVQEEAVKDAGIKVEPAAPALPDVASAAAGDKKEETQQPKITEVIYVVPKGLKDGTDIAFIKAALANKPIVEFWKQPPLKEAPEAYTEMIRLNAANAQKPRKNWGLLDNEEAFRQSKLDLFADAKSVRVKINQL